MADVPIPKEPRSIATLRYQIQEHPNYGLLPALTRAEFNGCYFNPTNSAYFARENNKYCRELWRHLYLGAPLAP